MAMPSILVTIPFLVVILVASPPATAVSATFPIPPAASPAAATVAANSSAQGPAPSTPTAYDLLEQYKLARGILPEGVTGYALHPDGSFEVYLPADCNLRVGGQSVRYSSVIKGNIQTQSISHLQGVHVKEVFVWIAITKVNADDGQLHFVAGPISKAFPIDKFANSPRCN